MFLVLLCLVGCTGQTYSQFAESYEYFGFVNEGGSGTDQQANPGQTYTIVMPYNQLALSESRAAFVHGFRYHGDVSGQPFRIQIWRLTLSGRWGVDGQWQRVYQSVPNSGLNGHYTLVHSTDEIYSDAETAHVYLDRAVQVLDGDFIGFSYRSTSPFTYAIEPNCVTSYTNTRLTSIDYPVAGTSYDFEQSDIFTCNAYSVGMLVEYTDVSDDCQRLNTINLDLEYTMTSHTGYDQQRNYDNNMDKCWIVHAYDSSYYLTFTVDPDESFDLEYFDSPHCAYDKLEIYSKAATNAPFVYNSSHCAVTEFPFDREIFIQAPIVRLHLLTDNRNTARGFKFYFRSVASSYTPGSTASVVTAGAASSDTESCKEKDNRWRWRCLVKAEKILLIFIIIMLVIAIVMFIIGCGLYQRSKENKINEEEKNDSVTSHKPPPYVIPYEAESPAEPNTPHYVDHAHEYEDA